MTSQPGQLFVRLSIEWFELKIVDFDPCALLQEADAHQQAGLTATGQHRPFHAGKGPLPNADALSRCDAALDR